MRTVLAVLGLLATPLRADDRLRVIVETDLGGDADDQASLVRFLIYANEWDVEGIIADRNAAAFDKDPVRDHLGLPAKDGYELALAYLKAYGEVYPNLSRHAKRYPTPGELRKRIVPGHNDTDAGVKLLTEAADRDDSRPIWHGNWGSNSGATSNLRRALDRAKAERTPAAFARFAGKFRVVTLDGNGPTRQGHDGHMALHVETGYPTLDGARWYHRFRPLTEKAGGFDVVRDVKKGGGVLSAEARTRVKLLDTVIGKMDRGGRRLASGREASRKSPSTLHSLAVAVRSTRVRTDSPRRRRSSARSTPS